MARNTRFFEIIQILRGATKPVFARELAEMLEVSVRTIYRDIATLQSMQTPIYGEAGVGYVMRKGYDLPPINFDTEEAEAISVGLELIARTGDAGLWRAAGRAARKLNEAAPGTRRLVASSWGMEAPKHADLGLIRRAIRDEQKLALGYCDVNGVATRRVIRPLALIYYVDAAIVVGWCELRHDFRHFRLDRTESCTGLDDQFTGKSAGLMAEWETTQKADTVTTQAP